MIPLLASGHRHRHRASPGGVPAVAELAGGAAVRGRVGAHQHRLGHVLADALRGGGRRSAHLRVAAGLSQRGRAGAGRLGARQHRGRLARVQGLCHRSGNSSFKSLSSSELCWMP